MDKVRIKINDFTSEEYVNGVKYFIKFSRQHIGERNILPCPCGECLNQVLHPPYIVKLHLLTNGCLL